MITGKESAYPESVCCNENGIYSTSDANGGANLCGLTKREYFAAIAMQGLLTRTPIRHGNETDLGVLESKRIAEESCIMADELIVALNKIESIKP